MTYYTFDKTKLLNVDNTFARLIEMDTTTLTFEFTYNVSQVDVIRANAMSVNISVFSRTIVSDQAPSVTNMRNAQNVVSSLQSRVSNVKKSIEQQKQYLVTRKVSDVSALVNNFVLSEINAGYSKDEIALLRKSKLKLVKDATGNSLPTLSFAQNSKKYSAQNAKTFMKNLLHAGIDPSSVVDLPNYVISAHESIAGVSSNVVVDELSSLKKLQDYYTLPNVDVAKQSIDYAFVNEPDDNVIVSVKITLPRADLTKLYVRFDLISDTMCVDTITKDLNIVKHVQLFSTPLLAPTLACKRSTNGESFLEIKQNDEKAKYVNVYKKVISTVTTANIADGYFLLSTHVLKKGENIRVVADECTSSFVVYRVIATSDQNYVSNNFSDVIVKPRFNIHEKTLVLRVLQIENGIKIEANNVPEHVVSIEILVRNLSRHENAYKSVDDKIHYIREEFRSIKTILVIDNNVSKGNVYEYVARLTYLTGESLITGTCIIEYIKSETNKVFTTIDNVNIDSITPNVSFDISTRISDTDNSNVKALLEAAGITQYDDLLLTSRDTLNVLIAHNVQRVDLTSGERSNFGIITDSKFSDNTFSINNFVSQLQPTHTYRYEVTPLLRASDTLFYDLTKTETDKETQKTYTYSPAKYLNPLTLDNGTLYSSVGIKQLNAKDQMSYGAIGNVIVTKVNFNASTTISSTISLERFDKNTNVITWKAGDLLSIDHFIVVLENINVKKILGRVHSQSEMCQFIHVLTKHDIGELSYEIVPVYNDYSVGTSIRTNSIIVEDI